MLVVLLLLLLIVVAVEEKGAQPSLERRAYPSYGRPSVPKQNSRSRDLAVSAGSTIQRLTADKLASPVREARLQPIGPAKAIKAAAAIDRQTERAAERAQEAERCCRFTAVAARFQSWLLGSSPLVLSFVAGWLLAASRARAAPQQQSWRAH